MSKGQDNEAIFGAVDSWRNGYRKGWLEALEWAKGRKLEEIEAEQESRLTSGEPRKGDSVSAGGSTVTRHTGSDAKTNAPAEMPAPLTLSTDDSRPNSPEDLGGYSRDIDSKGAAVDRDPSPVPVAGEGESPTPPPGIGRAGQKLWRMVHPGSEP